MKKVILIIPAILSVLFLSGCAALEEQARIQTCNTNAAYAQGVNDAQAQKSMQTNYASICQGNVAAINEAYKSGYMTVVKSNPKTRGEININIGHGGGRTDQWECIDLPFKSVCGYGCIRTPFNEVYCGARPGDNCVKNNFNEIKCGKHCHVTPIGSTITCDKERYSKNSDRP